MVPMGPLGTSIHNYGPTAGSFDPERWLSTSRAASPSEDASSSPDDADDATAGGGGLPDPLSFSVGPRDCVGQTLARLELQVVVAAMVAGFNWSPGKVLEEGINKEEMKQQEGEEGGAAGTSLSAAVKALYGTAQYHITLQPRHGEMLLRASPRT